MRIGVAHQPGRRLNRRPPGRLLGVGVARVGVLLGSRLDLVEVDVGVLPALLLVIFEADPATFELARLLADRLAERRVLILVGVTYDVALVPSAGLERTHVGDRRDGLHACGDTRARMALKPRETVSGGGLAVRHVSAVGASAPGDALGGLSQGPPAGLQA